MEVTSNVTPEKGLCWLNQGQIPWEGWDAGDSASSLPGRIPSAYAAQDAQPQLCPGRDYPQ